MFTVLIAAAIVDTHRPDISSDDVARIMTRAVESSMDGGPKARHMHLPRPLMIDAAGANDMFAALAGGSIALDTAKWLPSRPRQFRRTLEALACPSASVSPACRLRHDGTLVHVLRLRLMPDGQTLEMRLNFVYRNTHAADGRLTGYTSVLHIKKQLGEWTANVVAVAVG